MTDLFVRLWHKAQKSQTAHLSLLLVMSSALSILNCAQIARSASWRLWLTAAALAVGVLPAAPSHGALIVHEGFDYTSAETLRFRNGGTGFNTDWRRRSHDGNSAKYADYTITGAPANWNTGNVLSLRPDGGALSSPPPGWGVTHYYRSLTTPLADGTYYISTLLENSGANANGQTGLGSLALAFYTGTGIGVDSTSNSTLALTVGSNSGEWGFSDGSTWTLTGDSSITGGPTQLLLKLTLVGNNATVSLWVGAPDDFAGTSEDGYFGANLEDYSFTLAGGSPIRSLGFISSRYTWGYLDDIMIGTTWEDVVGAVPEPSRALLLVAAVMGCALRRGRRREWLFQE